MFVVEANNMQIDLSLYFSLHQHASMWVTGPVRSLWSGTYALQTHNKQNSEKINILPIISHVLKASTVEPKTRAKISFTGLGTFGEVA